MKGIILLAVFIGASGIAAAQDSRHRPAPASIAVPQTFAPPQEAYAAFRQTAAPTVPSLSACQLRLTKLADFQPLPLLAGPGECGAADAVLLRSVILPDQTKVSGIDGLRKYLSEDRIDQVAFSVLKHLETYAAGRSLTYNELSFLKQDEIKLKPSGYRMKDMVRYVVKSKVFLEK